MTRWDRSDTEALASAVVLAGVTAVLTELVRWAAERWLPKPKTEQTEESQP